MSKEIYNELTKSVPKEAMTEDKSRWNSRENKGIIMTSIKAQYVVERLNKIFGYENWDLIGKYQENEKGVIFIGDLIIDGKVVKSSVAGASNWKKNLADTYKSANTECLTKICSRIGIGNEVFKGNIDPSTLEPKNNGDGKDKQYYIQNIKEHIKQIVGGDLKSAEAKATKEEILQTAGLPIDTKIDNLSLSVAEKVYDIASRWQR